MRRACIVPTVILLATSAARAARVAVMADVYLEEGPGVLAFGNDPLELRLDPASGELKQIVYRPRNLVILDNAVGEACAHLDLTGEGLTTEAEPSRWRFERAETQKLSDGASLTVTSATSGWTLRHTYRLWPSRPALQHSATFTAGEGAGGQARGARLILPGLRLADPKSTVYAQLSNYPPTQTRFSELVPERTVSEQWSSLSGHCVLIHDAQRRLSVPVMYFSEQEYALADVIERRDSINIVGLQQLVCDVKPGQEIPFGRQVLTVVEGDWGAGLAAAQSLYDLVGLHPPERTWEAAARTVMYSAHPGGTIDSGWQDVGGFRDFARMLPYYRSLGVTMVWLLPIWHGYVYAPDDYYKLDPRLGTEEDLKALVDQAHGLGMQVLLDLIPHGPLDTSKLHEQHPDWICKNPDGSFQYWWGCLYSDYAHPGWQGYMADHATYWVQKAGVDGYRVDCAGGGPPNWGPYDDNRPTMSGLFGGLGVLRAARAKMETAKPDIFLLAEAGGPPLFESSNFTYNWAFAFGVLPRLTAEGAATWVPRAAEWLDRQRLTFPRGARQIMFLENHDTARALFLHGPGMQQALLALAAYGDNTPFLYHDQEIGYGPYLRKLYRVRADHEALTLGEASYTAIPADDPTVMTILRCYQGQNVVAAINFSSARKACTLDLSRCPDLDVGTRYAVRDVFAGLVLATGTPADLAATRVPLEAYSPAVIAFERASGEAPKTESAAGPPSLAGHKPTFTREGDRVTVDNGLLTVRIGPETGGLIESVATSGTDGHPLLGLTTFGSMQRRLWLGGEVRLGPQTLRSVEVRERGDGVEVTARGQVSRTVGGEARPAMDYEARHVIGAGPDLECALRLTPQVSIEGVLGSLGTTFSFPGADHWAANTFEGLLYDELVPRRAGDVPYRALYRYSHSDRLFSSHSIPLDPEAGFVGGQWPDGTCLLVRSLRGWSGGPPDSVVLKERLGDAVGLHAVTAWAAGDAPLTLAKGQAYELTYTLTVGRGGEEAVRALAVREAPVASLSLRAEGSRYVVETPDYRAAMARSAGGSLEELALTDGAPVIQGTNVYTDYGLYPEWRDPSGNKQRMMAPSNSDFEPKVTVERSEGRLRLTFAGLLRSSQGFGRGIASPPTDYRVTYDFGSSLPVKVACAARPSLTRAQVKAFLAQTLSLPGGGAWAVYAGGGPGLVASGRPPGPGDRVWQSAAAGGLRDEEEPRVLVEAGGQGGPVCVEFSRFVGLSDIQNLFLLQGRDSAVLFAAFLDGQPANLTPRWRTLRYEITLHRGALGEVAKALGLPTPGEGP